ncbi:MAG: PmoA family protein [Pirellulales bacterium]|nr:PmoA family protein [Pirellulales bacterium]
MNAIRYVARRPGLLAVVLLAETIAQAAAPAGEQVSLSDDGAGTVAVSVDGRQIAEYSYRDDEITRPFFARLRTPAGVEVTRRLPPDPQHDLADHPTFHPGLWLAFGDVSGSDSWRNKAAVELIVGSMRTAGGAGRGELSAKFRYADQNSPEQTVCAEEFRATILVRPSGWLLLWDSLFTADKPCIFGDQEEMGLGVRVATEMRSERQRRGAIPAGNGRILDAAGRAGGAEVWGKASPWCDFSGDVAGAPAGIAIFCHPDNVRPSWFHARDYGLLVANPFGRQAFKQGEPSRIEASAAHPLRLRFGVLVHDGRSDASELAAAYQEYLAEEAAETERSNQPDGAPRP